MQRPVKRQRISASPRYSNAPFYDLDELNEYVDYSDYENRRSEHDNFTEEEDDEEEEPPEDYPNNGLDDYDSLDNEELAEIDDGDEDEDEDEDEDAGLSHLRAQVDQKLKSRFEAIFEKYGHDFTDIGDEIDLETGEIVVNNGHLLEMQDETDAGYSGEGKGILRALTVEPSSVPGEPREADDEDDDENEEDSAQIQRWTGTARRVSQIVDSEEDDDYMFSETTPSPGQSGKKRSQVLVENLASSPTSDPDLDTDNDMSRRLAMSMALPGNQKYPSDAEIMKQFGMELGPQIIKFVKHQKATSNEHIEPAWRIPDPMEPPPRKRALVKSILIGPQDSDRSPSPDTKKSIWAPTMPAGRPRKDGGHRVAVFRGERLARLRLPQSPKVAHISSKSSTSRRSDSKSVSVLSSNQMPRQSSASSPGASMLDRFEDGIGQVLGESSKNLRPSLISNTRSLRVRPTVRHDPKSLSWTEAAAAIQELDPVLYAGIIEDAAVEDKSLTGNAQSTNTMPQSSTSSYGQSPYRSRHEPAPRRSNSDTTRTKKSKRQSWREKQLDRASAPHSQDSEHPTLNLNSMLRVLGGYGGDSTGNPTLGKLQFIGAELDGMHHRVAAMPCPHIDCASRANILYRCQVLPREPRSEITMHLSKAHNATPFPCEEIGCTRHGAKGYFSRHALAKHVKLEHPGMSAYDRLRHRIGEATFAKYDDYAHLRATNTRTHSSSHEASPATLFGQSNVPHSGTKSKSVDSLQKKHNSLSYARDAGRVTNTPNDTSAGTPGKATASPLSTISSPPKSSQARSVRFVIPASDDESSIAPSSARPSQERPAKQLEVGTKEIFHRNIVDPSYTFSDEEDGQVEPQIGSPNIRTSLPEIPMSSSVARLTPDALQTFQDVSKKATSYIYVGERPRCRFWQVTGCERTFSMPVHEIRHAQNHADSTAIECAKYGCRQWYTEKELKRHIKMAHKNRCNPVPEESRHVKVNTKRPEGGMSSTLPQSMEIDISGHIEIPTIQEGHIAHYSMAFPSAGRGQPYKSIYGPYVGDGIDQVENLPHADHTTDKVVTPNKLGSKESFPTLSPGPGQFDQDTHTISIVMQSPCITNFNNEETIVGHKVQSTQPPSSNNSFFSHPSRDIPHRVSKPAHSSVQSSPDDAQKRDPRDGVLFDHKIQHGPSVQRSMPPPPLPSRRLSTLAKQSTVSPILTEESRRSSAPVASSKAVLTPCNKLRSTIELASEDDEDELSGFDSGSAMTSRSASMTPSSLRRRIVSRDSVRASTPRTPSRRSATPLRKASVVGFDSGKINELNDLVKVPSGVDPAKCLTPMRRGSVPPKGEGDGKLSNSSPFPATTRGSIATPSRRKSRLSIDDGRQSDDVVVKTPGGTVKRCGDAGYNCEREFCFTCIDVLH
jgi:hypothetical protein